MSGSLSRRAASVLQPPAPAAASWSGWLDAESPAPGVRLPKSMPTLIVATLSGVVLILLYRYGSRFGWQMPMFRKEGFLENLTFFLEFWSALLCAFAAARIHRSRSDPQDAAIALAYAACGTLLFIVAMEEISWGQQLVAFQTPAGWGAINLQGEVTLHNLASKAELTLLWKVVGMCFLVGVVALNAVARKSRWKLVRFVAPPVTLVPLAVLIAFAAVRVHPEISEALMAVFFTLYSYRIYVLSTSYPL